MISQQVVEHPAFGDTIGPKVDQTVLLRQTQARDKSVSTALTPLL